MAAKKSTTLSLADIEKNIAKLSAELDKARVQKVSDAEKNLKQAQAALAAATDKTNQAGAAAMGKSKTKKVRVELEKQQQIVAAAEESLRTAKLELEIATESAKAATQARAQLATPVKKQPRVAKSAKKPKPVASPKKVTEKSEALPKARPVDYEPMGTAVTVPPASESSLLPEHGFTTLIEPRDNPLPKPQPV